MIGRLLLQMCDQMDSCVLCPSPRPDAEAVLRQELEDVPRCSDCAKSMRVLKKILGLTQAGKLKPAGRMTA